MNRQDNLFLVPIGPDDPYYGLANMTSFYGDKILVSVSKLKEFLGDYELRESGDGKVKYEAVFAVEDAETSKTLWAVTLYDWKEDWDSLTEEEPVWFHVGARSENLSKIGAALIKEAIFGLR